MARFPTIIALALFVAALPSSLLAGAEAASTDYSLGDSIPLDESELRNVTRQLQVNTPLLSSSPGIKFASAQRSVRSTDILSIIYFPHAETAEVKQAFQVGCWRQAPDKSWTCNDPKVRRYLKLESQDFEVRVTGDIGNEGARALIQAARATVQTNAPNGSVVPETAIAILPNSDGYLVTWGSPEGYQSLMVEAHLSHLGDPAEPGDWHTSIFEPGPKGCGINRSTDSAPFEPAGK